MDAYKIGICLRISCQLLSLHTGVWKLNRSESADNILEAINIFNQSAATKHLRQVRFVIYDQATMESFGGYATRRDTPSHGTDETVQLDLG